MTHTGQETVAEQAERPDPRRWQALSVCLVAGFMALLDVSIVNVALPSIQTGLQSSSEELSWVVSGYALTFGLVLIPSGRLGDDRGRTRMFLLSVSAFTVASVVAGFAPNATWLVVTRLVQGAAGGLLNPQILGVIQHQFRGQERGTAFGLFGATVGVSTAIGPLLGGLIIQAAGAEEGWRWVFFVNLPIGLFAVLLGMRVLPKDVVTGGHRSLDIVGVLLLAAGLVALLLPLVQSEQGGIAGHWPLLVVAAILLVIFVVWESRYRLRGRSPLIDLRLLRLRSYTFGASLALLYFAGFTGIFFVLAVYFQVGQGYTALESGLALTPFAVGSAGAAALGGRIVHRIGLSLVVVGLLAVVVGLVITDVMLSSEPGPEAGVLTAVPLLVAGLGSGLVISPNQTLTLSQVDVGQGGMAAGVQQTGQRIGSSVGIAATSGLFFTQLAEGQGYGEAIGVGLRVSIGFVLAALVLGVTELLIAWLRGEAAR